MDRASITSMTRPTRRMPRIAHTATVTARATTSPAPTRVTGPLPAPSRATSADPYQDAPENAAATSIP
jgi:hypothetical protein